MTLIRHEGQLQVTCDACPLTYRRTYAEEDFKILVEDIKGSFDFRPPSPEYPRALRATVRSSSWIQRRC